MENVHSTSSELVVIDSNRCVGALSHHNMIFKIRINTSIGTALKALAERPSGPADVVLAGNAFLISLAVIGVQRPSMVGDEVFLPGDVGLCTVIMVS